MRFDQWGELRLSDIDDDWCAELERNACLYRDRLAQWDRQFEVDGNVERQGDGHINRERELRPATWMVVSKDCLIGSVVRSGTVISSPHRNELTQISGEARRPALTRVPE